jgi:hypothetical protein
MASLRLQAGSFPAERRRRGVGSKQRANISRSPPEQRVHQLEPKSPRIRETSLAARPAAILLADLPSAVFLPALARIAARALTRRACGSDELPSAFSSAKWPSRLHPGQAESSCIKAPRSKMRLTLGTPGHRPGAARGRHAFTIQS